MLRRKSKGDQTGFGSPESGSQHLRELIARRAYELYEMRGDGPGDELTDWLIAEREVLGGMSGIEATVADRIATADAVNEPKLRRKSPGPTSAGVPEKKTNGTTRRSAGKPKGLHV